MQVEREVRFFNDRCEQWQHCLCVGIDNNIPRNGRAVNVNVDRLSLETLNLKKNTII